MSDNIETIFNKIIEYDHAISSNFEIMGAIARSDFKKYKRPVNLSVTDLEERQSLQPGLTKAGSLFYSFPDYLSLKLTDDSGLNFNNDFYQLIDRGLKFSYGTISCPCYISINGVWCISFQLIDKYLEPDDDWYEAEYMRMVMNQVESEKPYVPRTIKFNPRNQ